MGGRAGFDAGPLSWVKHEIDSAMQRGLAALASYAASLAGGKDDPVPLKAALAHLHQAHGALQIVGLDGVTRVSQELEGLLADMDKGAVPRSVEALATAERAFRNIAGYLDELIGGKPHRPLRLLAVYSALLEARGAGPADPADLYFPNMSRRPPPPQKSSLNLHPDEAKQFLRDQRARYLKGLLAYLRNDRTGAAEMRAAVEAIEQLQQHSPQRPFWWVALAFFDAMVHDALPPEADAKRLCNRIEQQIRALTEGSTNVAERMMREALYFVARAEPASEHLRQVRETYQLADSIPSAQAPESAEAAALKMALAGARDLHAKAKEAWDRFATGHAASLGAFCEAAAALRGCARGLGRAALDTLAERIAATGAWLAEDPSRMSEALALEQATALLLAQSALADFESLGGDFDEQAQLVCSRLTECMEGRLLRTAIDIPLLDEMSRRAQEELIAEQTLADMRTQLRAAEQVLDRFFRNPVQRAELAQLGKPLEQLDGALQTLGEGRAREALAACADRIRRFSASDFVARQPEFSRDCEQIAHTLSALGLHLDALSRGPADFEQAMRPVSAGAEQEEAALGPETTVEAKLAETHREAQKLADAWTKKPTDTWLKGELQKNLAAIQQDAGLVADARLQAAATEALRAIEGEQAQPMEPQVAQALGQIAPGAEPPAPSPAAERVVESAAEAGAPALDAVVDAELLAVYLEEAAEVLGNARAGLQALRTNGADHEALVGIRRGFHTLKGSGRMVGLTRLGEAAWAVEQTLNLWLQEDRVAQGPLLGFVSAALDYFGDGVERMKAGGSAPDERQLVQLAEAVRRGEPQAAPARPRAAEIVVPEGILPAVPEDEESFVDIGNQRISATLYTIFSGEARMHLATLKGEHETLKVHGVITDEMMRSAHTLAGIAGTVQLAALRDMGRALDRALSALSLGPLSADEEALVDAAVEAVERMVVEALGLAEPTPSPELVERLEHVAASTEGAAALPSIQQATPEVMVPEEEAAFRPAPLPPPAQPPAPAAPLSAAGAVEVESGPPERRQRRIKDELDAQLVPLFVEEANELIPAVGAAMREWRAAPTNAEAPQLIKRLLHTLKGSARMAGAMAMGELIHFMETRLERAVALGAPSAKVFGDLDNSMDRMGVLFERVQHPDAAGDAGEEAALPEARAAGSEAAAAAIQAGAEHAPMLRVRADLIDKLVDEAGEVSIARSRIEGEIRALRSAILELTDNVTRLRVQLREIEIQAESQMQSHKEQAQASRQEFDPLELDRFTRFQELTRFMAESVNDVETVHQNLVHAMDATDGALAAQARLNRDLQQDLMRVRMVPLASLAERLHRVVRQTAKELGKRASLDIRGGQVELDRAVLDRIRAPFEHMLRNAVSHGIETAQERAARGKGAIGEIRLDVSQEGNEVLMVLADDGAGLDLERLLARARELGIIAASAQPDEAEIADFIFVPGLSTADEVSEVAGRGVGMDVVRNEVASLGGRIELSFQRGRGTRFAIYLPLTLAVTQAVLVKIGARTYALPAVMVEHVMQMRAADAETLHAQPRAQRNAEWQGRRYPFHRLATLFGLAEAHAPEKRTCPVLLVRSGANAIALQVDEILSSSQEIVVKSIGPHIARLTGITGATVLGSGEIILILNPVQLAQRQAAPPRAEEPVAPLQAVVMVVDDSLTVRKITGRLLERQGYRVVTARDGVEAMEQLRELVPAAMLVDIEMPRMDGFELTRKVRADARLAATPIIMITSRAVDKHQQYAREIGVDHYLGKPYQEDELLGQIARCIAAGRPGVVPG